MTYKKHVMATPQSVHQTPINKMVHPALTKQKRSVIEANVKVMILSVFMSGVNLQPESQRILATNNIIIIVSATIILQTV